jgi:hypothetical protein
VHLDHAIARLAAERLTGVRVYYYEDQPYALLFGGRVGAERARLEAGPRRAAAGLDDVGRLLRPLAPFLSSRDLERLLEHHRTTTAPEPLWQRRSPPQNETNPGV